MGIDRVPIAPPVRAARLRTERRPGRKERERSEHRKEIMDAARAVFARKGYESATLDEIAELAEFAKGTIYNYFHSKEDILRHILRSLLDDIEAIAGDVARQGGGPREQFHCYAVRLIEYYKANEDFLRIVAREMNNMLLEGDMARVADLSRRFRKATAALASLLRRDIRHKHLVHAEPEELVHLFVSIIHSCTTRWFFEGKNAQSLDAEKEAAFIVRLFFDGITRQLPRSA